MKGHSYNPEGCPKCGKVHIPPFQGKHHTEEIKRETRTCAAPGCDITFEVEVTSNRKYCCGGHNALGKTWEERYGVEKAKEMKEGVKKWAKTPGAIEKAKKTRNETYARNGGLNHDLDCPCCICKAKRGETKGENNSFYGKHHTEESKRKSAEGNRKRYKDGTHALCNPEVALKRKKNALKALMENRPTSYEKIVMEVITDNLLPYRYVGDGSFWVVTHKKHINPDFIHNDRKLVVEVFDDFWKEVTYGSVEAYIKERKYLFQEKGFDVIFINRKDIRKGAKHLLNLLRGG